MAGSKMSFIGQKLQDKGYTAPEEESMEETMPKDPMQEMNQKIDSIVEMVQSMQERMDQYWPNKGEVGEGTNSTDMGDM